MWQIFFGIGSVCAGLLIGLAYAVNYDVGQLAKPWEILAAVGSIGSAVAALAASVVALRIASNSEATRNAENQARGVIVAGIVRPDMTRLLMSMCRVVENVSRIVVALDKAQTDAKVWTTQLTSENQRAISEAVSAIREEVPSIQLNESMKIFEYLHFLPEEGGSSTAAAIGEVTQSVLRLEELIVAAGKERFPARGVLGYAQEAERQIGALAKHVIEIVSLPDGYSFSDGLLTVGRGHPAP